MLENKIPLFDKGRILKKEALERLRDYPMEMFALLKAESSDGIVTGFDLRYETDLLHLGEGILKHKGNLYTLVQEQLFEINQFGEDCRLVFFVNKSMEELDFYCNRFSIELIQSRDCIEENTYELGRFRLERGAVLRTWESYLDFKDASTLINTLGIQGRRYSGRSGSTISPILTNLYAREYLAFCEIQPLDAAFCMLCFQERIVEQNAVVQYLNASGIPVCQADNPERLYEGLLKLLKERKRGNGTSSNYGMRKSRRTTIE